MKVDWSKKPGDVWSAATGPFVVKVQPKGDGRWSWQIFVVAAKTVTEQFVMRSGRV